MMQVIIIATDILYPVLTASVFRLITQPLSRAKLLIQAQYLNEKPENRITTLNTYFDKISNQQGTYALWAGYNVYNLKMLLLNITDSFAVTLLNSANFSKHSRLQLHLAIGLSIRMIKIFTQNVSDLLETKIAISYPEKPLSAVTIFNNIIETDGIKGILRGYGTAFFSSSFTSFCKLGIVMLIGNEMKGIKNYAIQIAVFTAYNCVTNLIIYPIDTIYRYNITLKLGFFDAAKYIYKRGGIKGFYAGFLTDTARLIVEETLAQTHDYLFLRFYYKKI